MKKLLLLMVLCTVGMGMLQAQNIVRSLEKAVPGQGKVTIHQDPGIEALLGVEHLKTGEQKAIKTAGYRVQAYAGNNTRKAQGEAHQMAEMIKKHFPETVIYTFFHSPRWLCRVGDFRSIEEADAMMRKMKATGVFKEVSIVRDQINIPL